MARRLRFHSPKSTYHAILRGNNRQNIFCSDADRIRLCLLLQQSSERFGHEAALLIRETRNLMLKQLGKYLGKDPSQQSSLQIDSKLNVIEVPLSLNKYKMHMNG